MPRLAKKAAMTALLLCPGAVMAGDRRRSAWELVARDADAPERRDVLGDEGDLVGRLALRRGRRAGARPSRGTEAAVADGAKQRTTRSAVWATNSGAATRRTAPVARGRRVADQHREPAGEQEHRGHGVAHVGPHVERPAEPPGERAPAPHEGEEQRRPPRSRSRRPRSRVRRSARRTQQHEQHDDDDGGDGADDEAVVEPEPHCLLGPHQGDGEEADEQQAGEVDGRAARGLPAPARRRSSAMAASCRSDPSTNAAVTTTSPRRCRSRQVHTRAGGRNRIATGVLVAARNRTPARAATSARPSWRDSTAHGATHTSAQIVFTSTAVFSHAAAGISTTSVQSASRTGVDAIQPDVQR